MIVAFLWISKNENILIYYYFLHYQGLSLVNETEGGDGPRRLARIRTRNGLPDNDSNMARGSRTTVGVRRTMRQYAGNFFSNKN